MGKENKYDCIVIGGGPAGMMAAISASSSGRKVLLLERGNKLGRKLLLTGNGRCNLSHKIEGAKDFAGAFGKGGDFLLSPFSVFGVKEVLRFFKENGLDTETGEDGKIFPKNGNARDVLGALVRVMDRGAVDVRMGVALKELEIEKGVIVKALAENGDEFVADNYIVTGGGKSFPSTGSDGNLFPLIEKIGHSVDHLYPALCSLSMSNPFYNLSGLSIKGELTLNSGRKSFFKGIGDILFTHSGITGPIVLDASNECGPYLDKGEVVASLDLFPDKTKNELHLMMEEIYGESNKMLKNLLGSIIPMRLADEIIERYGLPGNVKVANISKKEKEEIERILKGIRLSLSDLPGFDQSMATRGGVSIKEIDSKTMRSKIVKNLYFAGEVISLVGKCGGYNLQMCWTTGYIAGKLSLGEKVFC
jgi:predicted Rossmann fold flavoprotein